MTFDSYESSVDDGRPIHLFRFIMGETVWRYTSADEDLTIGGYVWKAVPITDDGVRESGESTGDSTVIEASVSIGPAQVYMSSPPSTTILVHRLALHEGMTAPIVNYSGEVVQVDFGGQPGKCKIGCQKLSATMRRNGLRLGYQRSCPYALYDQATCKVNRASYAVTVTLSAVDGFDVSSPDFAAHPANYFTGGLIEWVHPMRGTQYVAIESHSGGVATIFGDTSLFYPGITVRAYPGCARTLAACQSFNNTLNYGGFPAMPGKSPYDGTPVF